MESAQKAAAEVDTVVPQMDRTELERLREEALDQLALAKQRQRQVTEAFAIGNATEKDVAESDQSVRSSERRLEGLGYHEERVDAKEREEAEAAKAERRREDAVKSIATVFRYAWALECFDHRNSEAVAAASTIESIENELHIRGFGLSERNQTSFIAATGADGVLGPSGQIRRKRERLPAFSASNQFMVDGAIRVLARDMPEALDKAVQEEARELARREQAQFGEAPG